MRKITVIPDEDLPGIEQKFIMDARAHFAAYKRICEMHPDFIVMDVVVNWRLARYHLKGEHSIVASLDDDKTLICVEKLTMN